MKDFDLCMEWLRYVGSCMKMRDGLLRCAIESDAPPHDLSLDCVNIHDSE